MLDKIQKLIDEKNEYVLRDIELLKELEWMLRNGKAEIHVNE